MLKSLLKSLLKCKSRLEITDLRVKLGRISTSIDWVQSNDFEMLNNVISDINFVKEFTLYSDKFTAKDQ